MMNNGECVGDDAYSGRMNKSSVYFWMPLDVPFLHYAMTSSHLSNVMPQ